MFLKNIKLLENTYLIFFLKNLSFMDFLFHVPVFCTAVGAVAEI
jgi:hypothetical protein